ncbi:MAG: carbon-nitrogen hydrolase family protein [Hellea sp.]|nr:carbon-nitrogen hydrolase family protein [Hellea sp.]
MSKSLKIALPQIAPVWLARDATLNKIIGLIQTAAEEQADLIVFGEGVVPGYPFWPELTGGAIFNDDKQKHLFAHYSDQSVTIEDGHLNTVCAALRRAKMACYLGIIERPRQRSGHSLYASFVYIDKTGTIQSVHRKLQPTYEERLVWSPGDGAGLVTHRLGAFTVGGLNCWENWMPLSRAALYAQGEDLHIACWPGNIRNTEDITRMIAKEGRGYCVSVSSLMRRSDIPSDIPFAEEIKGMMPEIAADGGSCIASPDGSWLLEPVTGKEYLSYATLDPALVRKERQNFDPAGHYSRPDVTRLIVNRKRQAIAEFEEDE